MLEKLKLLLHCDDEELIGTLISLCKDEAYVYCNLEAYDRKLDPVVIDMVIERFNRLGAEGVNKKSTSGVAESYYGNYSVRVTRHLNKFRKVKLA